MPTTTTCSKCWVPCNSASPRSYQGRAAESLELATRALGAYQPDRHRVLGERFGTDQGVAAHVFAGWSHLMLGHLDRGLAQLVEAVDLAETLGRPFNRVFALAFWLPGTGNGGRRPRPCTSQRGPAALPKSRVSHSGPGSAACGKRPSV